MKAFEIHGHSIDGDGWSGEPIIVKILARNSRDAIRRFKAEIAHVVTKVTPITLDESLSV
jgi:hypothetical protein